MRLGWSGAIAAYPASPEHRVAADSPIRPLGLLPRHHRLGLAARIVATPARPRDLPKRPKRVPFIPADQLARLMAAVRTLSCPYQLGALLITRWSGARRGEVQRLDLDCLDAYPDGTPRLRIPVGKGKSERLVPIHDEAASAIRELQGMARDIRGFRDEQTGIESRRLFVFQGHILTADYLFEQSLARACAGRAADAGRQADDHGPPVPAHRGDGAGRGRGPASYHHEDAGPHQHRDDAGLRPHQRSGRSRGLSARPRTRRGPGRTDRRGAARAACPRSPSSG